MRDAGAPHDLLGSMSVKKSRRKCWAHSNIASLNLRHKKYQKPLIKKILLLGKERAAHLVKLYSREAAKGSGGRFPNGQTKGVFCGSIGNARHNEITSIGAERRKEKPKRELPTHKEKNAETSEWWDFQADLRGEIGLIGNSWFKKEASMLTALCGVVWVSAAVTLPPSGNET